MEWEEYEEITKYIYSKLGEKEKIKIICYGKNCKLEGESGVKHQIDVLTSHLISGVEHKTAIECKFHNVNIPKDPIMKLSSIMSDCNIEYGVLVGKKGFTSDAKKYAKHLGNISLIELRKPEEKDWDGRLRDMTGIISVTNPNIHDIKIYAEYLDENVRFLSDELIIYMPNKDNERLVEILIKQETPSPELHTNKVYKLDNLPEGTYITNTSGESYFSGKLCITYKIEMKTTVVSKTEYKGDDLVSYYLHDVFNNASKHIRNDGSIKDI